MSFKSQQQLALSELLAQMEAAPALEPAPDPAPAPTLRSYVETWGQGMTIEQAMVEMGYSPRLAENIDLRLQAAPITLLERLAQLLNRPLAELVWAAGARSITAPAIGFGQRVLP